MSMHGMHSPHPSMSSVPVISDPTTAGYDPLAAMMAPPARKIPTSASYSNMPSGGPLGTVSDDPLAAMMAPPAARYPPSSGAKSSGSSGPPPSLWKPSGGSSQFMQVPTGNGGNTLFNPNNAVSLSLSDNDSISLEYPATPTTNGGPIGAPPVN